MHSKKKKIKKNFFEIRSERCEMKMFSRETYYHNSEQLHIRCGQGWGTRAGRIHILLLLRIFYKGVFRSYTYACNGNTSVYYWITFRRARQ